MEVTYENGVFVVSLGAGRVILCGQPSSIAEKIKYLTEWKGAKYITVLLPEPLCSQQVDIEQAVCNTISEHGVELLFTLITPRNNFVRNIGSTSWSILFEGCYIAEEYVEYAFYFFPQGEPIRFPLEKIPAKQIILLPYSFSN